MHQVGQYLAPGSHTTKNIHRVTITEHASPDPYASSRVLLGEIQACETKHSSWGQNRGQGRMGSDRQRLTVTITKRPKESLREVLTDVTEGSNSHFFSQHTWDMPTLQCPTKVVICMGQGRNPRGTHVIWKSPIINFITLSSLFCFSPLHRAIENVKGRSEIPGNTQV